MLAALAQSALAVVLGYAAALGFVLIWFWQCVAQGRDPWLENNRSSK